MNTPTRRRIPGAVFLALTIAMITLALPSKAKADAGCREGHSCTVNGQAGNCGAGNGACYCYQNPGTMAEREPACDSSEEM